MTTRRHRRPIETLRSALKNEDIEQVMAAMFPEALAPDSPALSQEQAGDVRSTSTEDAAFRSGGGHVPASTVDDVPRSSVDVGTSSIVSVEPVSLEHTKSPSSEDVGLRSTGDFKLTSTEDVNLASTEDDGQMPAVERLWLADNNAVFRQERVRRIQRAQDALSHPEESVYDVLWGTKNNAKDSFRLTSLGYDAIAQASRVAKRNVRFIIERLIRKGFLEVARAADSVHRIPTQYKVFGYRAALDRLRQRKHLWVVRTGNGVLFARPFRDPTQDAGPSSPEDAELTSTGDVREQSTVDARNRSTVAVGAPSPEDAASPLLDNSSFKTAMTTTSSCAVITTAMIEVIGVVDDGAATRFLDACLQFTPDITDDELTVLVKEQLQRYKSIRGIDNPIGLLIRNANLQSALKALREKWAKEDAQIIAFYEQLLADPDAPEEAKEEARRKLGRHGAGKSAEGST